MIIIINGDLKQANQLAEVMADKFFKTTKYYRLQGSDLETLQAKLKYRDKEATGVVIRNCNSANNLAVIVDKFDEDKEQREGKFNYIITTCCNFEETPSALSNHTDLSNLPTAYNLMIVTVKQY